jgi:hypothetical protein
MARIAAVTQKTKRYASIALLTLPPALASLALVAQLERPGLGNRTPLMP